MSFLLNGIAKGVSHGVALGISRSISKHIYSETEKGIQSFRSLSRQANIKNNAYNATPKKKKSFKGRIAHAFSNLKKKMNKLVQRK